jgi:hypothetical protein
MGSDHMRGVEPDLDPTHYSVDVAVVHVVVAEDGAGAARYDHFIRHHDVVLEQRFR